MGEIKSAYEIAMERMENVKGDKTLVEAHQYKESGQKIASKFLNDPEEKDHDLTKQLKQYSGRQKAWIKEGIFETLINNVVLPLDQFDDKQLKIVEKGMTAILPDRRFVSSIFNQIRQFFQQYIENKKQIRESLESQFSAKLRQKEQELSQRLGTEVKLDPEQDPEFATYLKQHLGQLSSQYQEALDQGKDQLRQMFDRSK